MFGKTAALALAAAVAMASAADAAPKKGDPNPPHLKASTEEAAKAWVKRYVDEEDFLYLLSGSASALLLQASTFRVKEDGTIRYWIKEEGFAPLGSGAETYRSSMVLYESHCGDERMRILAIDNYLDSNLQGELVAEEDDSEAKWFFPRPTTLSWAVNLAACTAAEGYREAAEEAAEKEAAQLGVWRPVEKTD